MNIPIASNLLYEFIKEIPELMNCDSSNIKLGTQKSSITIYADYRKALSEISDKYPNLNVKTFDNKTIISNCGLNLTIYNMNDSIILEYSINWMYDIKTTLTNVINELINTYEPNYLKCDDIYAISSYIDRSEFMIHKNIKSVVKTLIRNNIILDNKDKRIYTNQMIHQYKLDVGLFKIIVHDDDSIMNDRMYICY